MCYFPFLSPLFFLLTAIIMFCKYKYKFNSSIVLAACGIFFLLMSLSYLITFQNKNLSYISGTLHGNLFMRMFALPVSWTNKALYSIDSWTITCLLFHLHAFNFFLQKLQRDYLGNKREHLKSETLTFKKLWTWKTYISYFYLAKSSKGQI